MSLIALNGEFYYRLKWALITKHFEVSTRLEDWVSTR
jgi:hypothetical protein